MDDDMVVLAAAWRRWDAKPGDEWRAKSMERACATVAARLGVSTTVLRARLAGLRRDGKSIAGALGAVASAVGA